MFLALASLAFSFACINREAVNSLAPNSRSPFFRYGDSLTCRSKRKGHGGKKRHWKQNECGLHSKSMEESPTGTMQGWAHNDGILKLPDKPS